MKLSTSKEEIIDIAKSYIVISLAFAILMAPDLEFTSLLFTGIISMLTVGIGFVGHELAHKILAQKYGCMAEFRSNDTMLALTLLMSFTGFLFAAPGAVMIHGQVGASRYGKISAAGPISSLFIGFLFMLGFLFSGGLIQNICYYGYSINTWLGLFNLIPIGNFDGIKILAWDKKVYYSLLVTAIVLVSVKYFV